MKFQMTTDYAIRVIIYLAQNASEILPAKEIAKRLGITYGYFNKVAARLRHAGLIESVQGPDGGFRLAKPSEEITLYDIIEVMEGSIHINRCLEEDGLCTRYEDNCHFCPVHQIFQSVQNQLVTTLSSQKVCDIAQNAWLPVHRQPVKV